MSNLIVRLWHKMDCCEHDFDSVKLGVLFWKQVHFSILGKGDHYH